MENQQVEFITNWNCNLRCYGCDTYSHLIKYAKSNENLLKDMSLTHECICTDGICYKKIVLNHK